MITEAPISYVHKRYRSQTNESAVTGNMDSTRKKPLRLRVQKPKEDCLTMISWFYFHIFPLINQPTELEEVRIKPCLMKWANYVSVVW